MALSSTGVFEVSSGGNDNNAGYFNPSGGSPGTDYSLQNAAQVTIDGATVTATVQATTTQLLIAGATVLASWNRNGLRITGGTATAGLYEITAVNTGTNVITVDRSAGTSTQTATGRVGGALATQGQASALMVASSAFHLCYVKSGSYTITSSSANVSGGRVDLTTGDNDTISGFVGYDTTRTVNNTDANRPTITASGISGVSLIKCSASFKGVRVRNLICDGASLGTMTGFEGNPPTGVFENCKAQNCTTAGFKNCHGLRNCFASACGKGFDTPGWAIGCVANACTTRGFENPSVGCFFCVASNNSGGSTDGFQLTSLNVVVMNCTAYNNGRDGFQVTTFCRASTLVNCVSTTNGRYGFRIDTSSIGSLVLNCAARSNTSGQFSTMDAAQESGSVTITADPFANAGSGDFSLNSTAGGGAALRAAGFPGAFPSGTTTGYLDVGAAQHQDAGGGGLAGSIFGGTVIR